MAACQFHAHGGTISHVIHIQFDGLHLQRDTPNVPSDLELMPQLYRFLTTNGVIAGNHHTVLPAGPATDNLTILTGLYGDRMGVPLSDSYGVRRSDGTVGFTSAYAYWTALAPDGLPQMLAENGKMAPAPWVPFTRAGCDVGVFAMANMAFESAPSDIVAVFGDGSGPARAAAIDPIKARADYLGIAVHCAQYSRLCADPAHAQADLLPDEPGGYKNFSVLFGNINVAAMLSPRMPIRDIDGNVLRDAYGNLGFPNLFMPNAAQSLGYAATMLEAGVPVVYAYIGDTHEEVTPDDRHEFGPGDVSHISRLAKDDQAFAAFIARLQSDGITPQNTLFILASNDGGHFVGGAPAPAQCDGLNQPCSYSAPGAINVLDDRLLSSQFHNVTSFDLRFGTAPGFYIHGNPSPMDPVTRTLAQDVSRLSVRNPTSKRDDLLTIAIADRAAMMFLHLVTASPARTPNFVAFGAPDYFQMTSMSRVDCAEPPACVEPDASYAWTRGGLDRKSGLSWFGLVGPGVLRIGLNTTVFTDHADIRPTLLALLGLSDDYVHDGRVVTEFIEPSYLSAALQADLPAVSALGAILKQIDAPLGTVARDVLTLSTSAIKDSDSVYQSSLSTMQAMVTSRDIVARSIKLRLDDAAFENIPIGGGHGADLEALARSLIDTVSARARERSSISPLR